ncbi:MAG: Uncharacterised protein [SAR116 cluster bacterium]|nr:MAG: Uncharacterised protein [SAR116 cluster bacterium]
MGVEWIIDNGTPCTRDGRHITNSVIAVLVQPNGIPVTPNLVTPNLAARILAAYWRSKLLLDDSPLLVAFSEPDIVP